MAIEEIQPTTIEALTGHMSKAFALRAGLQLDLFTALQDGPLTAAELAKIVQGDTRRLSGLLYFLVGAGLLTVSDQRFANTPEADRWLVRGRPGSFVNREGWWSESWYAYSKTAESIRAGQALANHDYATMSSDELRAIYRGFDPYARARGEWLAKAYDFADCRSLIDVGAGSGGVSVALTNRYPDIHATVADLPSVIPITDQFLAEAGATNRVGTLGVDLLAGPLPGSYDVAVLNEFLQVFDPEDAGLVLRHVGAAVRPEGTLYIIGHALDDTRLAPLEGLWFNFAAISFYQRGQAHTGSEYKTWLADACFHDIVIRWEEPPTTCVTIIARKAS